MTVAFLSLAFFLFGLFSTLPCCFGKQGFLQAGCTPCDDIAAPEMSATGQGDCASAAPSLLKEHCNNSEKKDWFNKRYCRMSCYKTGKPYEEERCCRPSSSSSSGEQTIASWKKPEDNDRTYTTSSNLRGEPSSSTSEMSNAAMSSFKHAEGAALGGGDVAVVPTRNVVTIVGAGATGLSAAYTLKANGIQDVVILEASSKFGGRVQKDTSFTDFHMDTGASFIQFPWQIEQIVGNAKTEYAPGTGLPMFSDYTWYDFFEDYIVDESIIEYNCQVDTVDYRNSVPNNLVEVTCGDRTFISNYAIVTVPLPVLKDGDIEFKPGPNLPASVMEEPNAWMWGGFKIFIEFRNNFYNGGFCFSDFETLGDSISLGPECINGDGESLFWDYSSVHPNTNKHIMAGLILGRPSDSFVRMNNDTEIAMKVLGMMDGIFGGAATPSYKRHFVVNWSMNPFIRGSLSSEACASGSQFINNKLLVAGETFPPDDMEWGWVDSGVYSGDHAAKQIILHSLGRTVTKDFYRRVIDDQQ